VSSLATLVLPLRDLLGELAATLAMCHALLAARAGDLATFMALTGDAEVVMLERRFRVGERARWDWVREVVLREWLWYIAGGAGKYARSPVGERGGSSCSMLP
jgi:hypothetical protein